MASKLPNGELITRHSVF